MSQEIHPGRDVQGVRFVDDETGRAGGGSLLGNGGSMIEARQLTKRYGGTLAVDDLSFDVRPGMVTGFLGPNGAGKTTTMRIILGLDHPNEGQVTIDGRRYRDLPAPLHEVGALLDAKAVHGGRSAYNHLLCLAQSNGIPRRRVDEVLGIVGLQTAARKRSGTFSLGMGQRLGIAAALLGDPGVLMFDEPVNGLDPEGIVWVRTLMRALAAEGRTVLVSSHLMSEMALTADHLIVIGRGRLIRDEGVNDFVESSSRQSVRVRSPQVTALSDHLRTAGAVVRGPTADMIEVSGLDAAAIGELAAANQLVLHELTPQKASLEEAFMELTSDSVEYHASGAVAS
jgi:ABC-2 type transport system ATP-binding protein